MNNLERKKSILGFKLTKTRALVLLVAILALVLTIALRGQVAPQSVQIVDGTNYLSPIYGETQYATTGYSDNFKNWTASGGAVQSSTSSLVINGSFPASNSTLQVVMSKSINVNVSKFPIVYFHIEATPGVKFGMLFRSTLPNGSTAQLKTNGALNLNQGLGYYQSFQSNLLLHEQNLGNITSAYIYVERTPSAIPTTYSLEMNSFEFLNYPTIPLNGSGAYHSAYLTFKANPLQDTSFSLDHVNLGASISAPANTTFVIYLVENQDVYYMGEYQYTSTIANYEYTLGNFNGAQPNTGYFTDSLPKGNLSIVFVTTAGYIESFQVGYVTFVSLPASHASLAIPPQDYRALYTYVIFFLFLLPLLGSVLIYDKFRSGSFNGSHIRNALFIGIVARLALAPISGHPYDLLIFASSDRSWYQFGLSNTSLGPTLPLTFFLYRVPYSIYALLEILGFHDVYFAQSQVGMLESVFVKGFPIIADVFVFFIFTKISRENNYGALFGVFYFLNPLSIYVSSIWGQYEAAASAMLLLGFYFLLNQTKAEKRNLFAGLAITISALINLFALIPLSFIVIKEFFAKPFRVIPILLLAVPLLLFLIYRPELHLAYLVLLSAFGAVPALGFSSTNAYSLASNFPALQYYHPLMSSLFLIIIGFIVYAKYDLETVAIFTTGAFLSIILFGAQLVQWWALIPPLGLLVALIAKKYALGIFTLPFGSLVAFVAFSYTQGSGYMIVGNQGVSLMPLLEQTRNNLLLFTLSTSIASLLFVVYMLRKESSGEHTLRNSSLILVGAFIAEFIIFGIF